VFYLSATGEAAAKKKLREFLAEYNRGNRPAGSRRTVKQYLEDWLETRVKPPQKSYSTYRHYEGLVRIHVVPEIDDLKLAEMQPRDIQRMLASRSKAKPDNKFRKSTTTPAKATVSPSTVAAVRTMLRKAFNNAVKLRLIDRNPVVLTDPPKRVEYDPKPFSERELPMFLEAIKGDRLEAFFLMAVTLGLREGELFGLQWCDLDFDAGELIVRRQLQREPNEEGKRVPVLQPTKSHRSKRPLPLPANVTAALKAHLKAQELERAIADDRWQGKAWKDLVFCTTIGTPLDPSNVDKAYKAALVRGGLERRRFHDLRATCGTMLARLGVPPRDAQLILGHVRVSTTLGIYTKVTEQGVRESIGKLDALMGSGEGKNE
jgi:integrase